MDEQHGPTQLKVEFQLKEIPNLSRSAYLSDNVDITQSGHIRMSPSMNGNIISRVKGREELGGIRQDVDTDHKVRGRHILAIQELNKCWGTLHKRR